MIWKFLWLVLSWALISIEVKYWLFQCQLFTLWQLGVRSNYAITKFLHHHISRNCTTDCDLHILLFYSTPYGEVIVSYNIIFSQIGKGFIVPVWVYALISAIKKSNNEAKGQNLIDTINALTLDGIHYSLTMIRTTNSTKTTWFCDGQCVFCKNG